MSDATCNPEQLSSEQLAIADSLAQHAIRENISGLTIRELIKFAKCPSTADKLDLLYQAVKTGNCLQFAKRLLQCAPEICLDTLHYDETLLFTAARHGRNEMIDLFLEYGANIDALSECGTALVAACDATKVETVKHLLKKGADINCCALKEKKTPILVVINKHYRYTLYPAKAVEILHILLDHKADISDPRVFVAAVANYDRETVKRFIALGVDVNARTGHENALGVAVAKNNIDLVRFLLDNGANVNSGVLYKKTALGEAASNNKLDIVQLLIERGADVNANDEQCKTAIERCAFSPKSAALLLAAGAKVPKKMIVNMEKDYSAYECLKEAYDAQQKETTDEAHLQASALEKGIVVCRRSNDNMWEAKRVGNIVGCGKTAKDALTRALADLEN